MLHRWPQASPRSATQEFDRVLAKSGVTLSVEERMQITGEGVDTVLRPGFMPFDAFVFLVIKALGASDAEGLSTEESYSFVIFLRAAVQMGLLRWGVMIDSLSETDALRATKSVHDGYGMNPGQIIGSC